MIAKVHEKAKKTYSEANQQATLFRRELDLPEALETENEVPTVYAKNHGHTKTAKHQAQGQLRTFARKFSNIDFFLQILPLKDDELVMSEM